ncbi:MAG TPA: outer membrane beta-barrel protein, partial [Longimicrobium sp.]|uniref:outer membrane beta-barrel protein n=1 Tax=Longimicrobium sp. TaxID=2029185 RepID=UPI002EDBB226
MIKQTLAAGLAVLLAAGSAAAQSPIPFSIEGRVDRAVPLGDFDDLVDAGFSTGVAASVQVRPGLGVYASYNYAVFGPKIVSDADDAVDQGVSLGLTAAIPTGTTRLQPYVAAGLVAHQFKLYDEVEAEEEIGFEVGAGVAIPLVGPLRLTPSVAYRTYNADPKFDDNPVPQPG